MTQHQPLTWIVIPTWNRSEDLQECLSSLRRLTYPNFRTVVVDNGSTDDTREVVRQQFPEVDLIPLRTNQGAPVASNAGFQHALNHGAVYALRLDSDTVVASDFLSRLVAAAENEDDIGGLVGTVYYYHEPGRIWSMGARRVSFFYDTRDVAHGDPPRLSPDEAHDIDYAWSAGILLSRQALEVTHGFDPDFFVYYEEMDFCERLWDAGLRLCLVPGAHMWHKVGELKTGPQLAYRWAQGKIVFFRKHNRGLRLLLLVLYAYAYALGRAVRPKAQGGNRGPLVAVLRGLTAGLTQRLTTRHV